MSERLDLNSRKFEASVGSAVYSSLKRQLEEMRAGKTPGEFSRGAMPVIQQITQKKYDELRDKPYHQGLPPSIHGLPTANERLRSLLNLPQKSDTSPPKLRVRYGKKSPEPNLPKEPLRQRVPVKHIRAVVRKRRHVR